MMELFKEEQEEQLEQEARENYQEYGLNVEPAADGTGEGASTDESHGESGCVKSRRLNLSQIFSGARTAQRLLEAKVSDLSQGPAAVWHSWEELAGEVCRSTGIDISGSTLSKIADLVALWKVLQVLDRFARSNQAEAVLAGRRELNFVIQTQRKQVQELIRSFLQKNTDFSQPFPTQKQLAEAVGALPKTLFNKATPEARLLWEYWATNMAIYTEHRRVERNSGPEVRREPLVEMRPMPMPTSCVTISVSGLTTNS